MKNWRAWSTSWMVLRETSVAHPISLANLPEKYRQKMRTAKFESSLIWEDKHTNALVLLEGNCIHCYISAALPTAG